MKRLLLSTAIFGAATVPAIAQDQTIFREAPEASELRASSFMGMRVYASETAVEGGELEGVQEGWEDIGEVNDIVMDRNGEVQAVLVDIGGFLGIGERTVAVSMDALQFVSDSATAEDAEDFFLVMNANREALENAPEYVNAEAEGMSAEQAASETDTAIEAGEESVAATGAAAGAAAGAAVGAAVEGAEQAGQEVVSPTVEATEGAGGTAEQTGDMVADTVGEVAQDAEAAAEQTGAEIAGAGEELSGDAAASGGEITEEVAQTDAVLDEAEVTNVDPAATETVVEGGEQVEATAEAAATEAETATQETAEAAVEPAASTETVPVEDAEVASTEGVTNTEPTSAETTREPLVREGFAVAGAEDLTAERLQGAAVYDANDQRVGEVGEIVLSADGQVQQLVIDVGGFLGIGEKPVALEMSSLDILRQEGGEEVRIYVSQTEEELEQLERYEAQ